MKTHAKIMDEVRGLLYHHENARNSDKYLIYLYLTEIGEMKIDWEEWKKIPSFETITRCRRKIQEDGDLIATDPDVIFMRDLKKEEVMDFFMNKA